MTKARTIVRVGMSLVLALLLIFTAIPINVYADTSNYTAESGIVIKTGNFSVEITDSSGNPIAASEGEEGAFHTKTIQNQSGIYYYTAYDENNQLLGSGQFEITAETTEIVLRQVVFRSEVIESNGINYKIEVTDSAGTISFQPGETKQSFVLPALNGDDFYQYKFIPEDTNTYWGSSGIMYVYSSENPDNFSGLNLSDSGTFLVAPKKEIQIQVPAGAELKIYHRVKFYRPLEEIETSLVKTEDETSFYTAIVPDGTKLHYEVRQFGKITKAMTFSTSEYNNAYPLIVDELTDRGNDEIRDESQSFYEANLYMNVPDSKYLELKIGEYFDVTTFRSWQAVNSGTENYYVEPDYHYEVMESDASEPAVSVDQSGRITALRPGISVVKITYDPLEFESALQPFLYSGIWKENTGIIVVHVGEDSNASKLMTGISLTEYDTVYYIASSNGEKKESYAEYTFTPSADGDIEVRVQEPLTTDWNSGWQNAVSNVDGSFTVQLKEGRNIVEVKSGETVKYHVIAAKGLNLTISNLTNPEKAIVNGDKVKVSFDGLKMPVPKLAAIYNPGFPNETWVEYEYDGISVKSDGVQYTITKDNAIEFYVDEAGTATLTNGRIHTTSIGENESAHRKINKASMNSNYTGGDSGENINGYYSILPDIEIEVEDQETSEEEARRNYANLSELKFGSTLSGKNYANYSGNVPQALFAMYSANQTLKLSATAVNGDCSIKVYNNDTQIGNCEKGISNPEIIKIVVTPNDSSNGYTKTYTIVCVPLKSTASKNQVPCQAFGDFSLILNIDGKDVTDELELSEANNLETYGYGFMSGFENYNISVPYNAQNAEVTLAMNIVGGPITQGNEKVGRLSSTVKVFNNEIKGEKLSTGSVTNMQKIALNEGTTSIPVSIKNESFDKSGNTVGTKEYSFKLNFIRESAPVKISIENLRPDAKIVIKNSKGSTIEADSEGNYELSEGKYDYYISCDGYETMVGSHTVTSESSSHTLVLGEMEKLPVQKGNVAVQISGYDAQIKPLTTVEISEPQDLAAKKYVSYNHGGYTVLHAMIDALENGMTKISFECRKGNLIPKGGTIPENSGPNAGWVCEVNGVVCDDPANTLVKDGDQIIYYYNVDCDESMTHAWFNPSTISTEQNSAAKLTLVGTAVKNDGSEATPIADAEIYIGEEKIGTTDENGVVTVPAEKLSSIGTVRVTAVKKNAEGENILTYALATITVKKPLDPSADPNKTVVTFRLIGDAKHGASAENHAYTTWIATKTYTFNSPSVTVGEVFKKALDEAGLSYVGYEKNYISTITAPKAYGGYDLSEFSNGKNSGWMYTVNGNHPEVGLRDCVVTTGDVIIWHYVDDYLTEVSDWYAGSQGNSSTWDKWLLTPDTNPPTDGTVIDMSGENTSEVTTSGTSGSATTTAPTEVTVSGSTATATVKSENAAEAIKQAKENKSAEIVLNVAAADTKGAETVKVQLDTATVKSVVSDTSASLTVKTENGQVSLDREALTTVVSEAKGATITLEVVKVLKPTEAQQKAAGTNGYVIRLVIKSGDKIISNFNKGKATVTVEISTKLQDKKVAAIHIAEDGKIEQLPGKTVKIDGKVYYTFGTPHFSAFALVDAEELGLEVNDEEANIVKIKELVSDMSLKARSSKTSKKSIKVTLTVDKSTAAAIKEIEDMGYTVKYKYYRSTKKASKYQAKLTKTTKTFTNTAGKKGTRYYYKARIQVYDKDGKLIAQTALKQCKYAVRTWTK